MSRAGIDILYRDDSLIVVNKAENLLSVPGIGPEKQDCVINRLLTIEPEAKVVHRLDYMTSGVMVFAIGIDMQRALNRLFQKRRMEKAYIALVRQWFDENEGVIKFPMRLDIDNRPYQIVDYEHGKPAITHWRVLQRSQACTRLLLLPQTGRTHQLRVHCAAMGHPIIGDTLYGNDEPPAPRMMLHASRLAFTHPFSNTRLEFTSPCPFPAQDCLQKSS